MKLRRPFQILLLCIIVFAIYFPTLTAEVSLVDDLDVITDLNNSESFTIKSIFVPRIKDGGYYRPLIGLGYYLDISLWGLNVRSMHLDNIVMHLINVVLVFFLTLLAQREVGERKLSDYLPFISATLFALHPIATESVNWISGRTDPMAANFVLSAAILLVLFRTSRKSRHLVSAILLILLGVLAKEASLGMVLATGFILYAHKTENAATEIRAVTTLSCSNPVRIFLIFYALIVMEVMYLGNYWVALIGASTYAACIVKPWQHVKSGRSLTSSHLVRLCAIIAISGSLLIGLYAALRKIAFTSDASKIGHTIKLMLDDTNYAISLFLGAAGFYLKKFFLPMPLNFFILEIDPLYDLAGIVVLLLCVYLMTRLTLPSSLFLAGVCMFVPALPFAFGTIAWTGYAERYIYLSSAFWIVAIALYLNSLMHQYGIVKKIVIVAVPVLLVFMGYQTLARNIVWQTNVTLLADTVEKSPKISVIREMYMQALVNAGLYNDAKEQYTIGTSHSYFSTEGPGLIMAQILEKEGRLEEALSLSEESLAKYNPRSEPALKATIALINRMIADGRYGTQRLVEKKNLYESTLLKVSKNPMLFYNLGQKALGDGDRPGAIEFFQRANSAFPEGNPYKEYSLRLLTRLKKDTK